MTDCSVIGPSRNGTQPPPSCGARSRRGEASRSLPLWSCGDGEKINRVATVARSAAGQLCQLSCRSLLAQCLWALAARTSGQTIGSVVGMFWRAGGVMAC